MREPSVDELLVGSSPHRYICEIHREIWDWIEQHGVNGEKDKALNLVAEAYWAGKRMSDRLNDLRVGWQKDENFDENPDYESDLARRAARLNLLKNIKSVNIETIDYCNRKCDWCPNKDRETTEGNMMTWNTFQRIVRQLMEYDYKGNIHPFLRGEPTLDRRILAIVTTLKGYLPDCLLRIVTNGAGLNSARVKQLFDAGLDSLHLNHYDGPLKDIGKARDADFEKMTHFGMKELLPTFNNRAGKVDCEPAKKSKRCDNFMHKLVFTWTGDVVLCCNDWDEQVVFGNINEQPLSVILADKKYRGYYYAHREGLAKDLPLCRECNVI